MATRRQRQVAELLHEEISQLIQYETRDPRLGFVTVTGVDINADLRFAKVYITVLGNKQDAAETLEGLASATQFFRHRMRQNLSLRYIPELSFRIDESLEYGIHIDELLDEIQSQPEQDSDLSDTEPDK